MIDVKVYKGYSIEYVPDFRLPGRYEIYDRDRNFIGRGSTIADSKRKVNVDILYHQQFSKYLSKWNDVYDNWTMIELRAFKKDVIIAMINRFLNQGMKVVCGYHSSGIRGSHDHVLYYIKK